MVDGLSGDSFDKTCGGFEWIEWVMVLKSRTPGGLGPMILRYRQGRPGGGGMRGAGGGTDGCDGVWYCEERNSGVRACCSGGEVLWGFSGSEQRIESLVS